MSQLTTSIAQNLSAPARTGRQLGRIYALQFKCELLKQLRIPIALISTILFPATFYTFFGLVFGANGAFEEVSDLAAPYLARYGAFGVIGVALFSFGVGVATERAQGWLHLQRATPMPPMAYFTAKIGTSLVLSTFSVSSLFTAGMVIGGVRLPLDTWLALVGMLVIGTLPFCALGLLIAYSTGPNSAVAIANLIYLPLSLASGLWIPLEFLPDFMQRLALYLPAYHYAQLALVPLGANDGQSAWVHILALLGFTAVCLLLANIAYRRHSGQTYG